MAITTRLATSADVAALKRLDGDSAEADAVQGRKYYVLRSRRMIDYFLACDGLIVAESEGQIVGYVLTHLVEWMHGVERLVWLEHIGVHPRWRRKGVGTKLLRAARRQWRGKAGTLYGEIHPKNERSFRMFEKDGAEMAPRILAFREIR